jgi:SAM-dependent methyltransferase
VRKTFRKNHNKEYWQKRWSAIQIDEAQEDETSYPLKYALEVISSTQESILEAGCGNGRILRYFNDRGYNIKGFDFIGEAINNLKKCDPQLRVEVGDIKDLKYN